MSIKEKLENIRLALVSTNNCLTTDRPDLVNTEADIFWTIDNTEEISNIDEILKQLECDK
jgi:hypothetical protein